MKLRTLHVPCINNSEVLPVGDVGHLSNGCLSRKIYREHPAVVKFGTGQGVLERTGAVVVPVT